MWRTKDSLGKKKNDYEISDWEAIIQRMFDLRKGKMHETHAHLIYISLTNNCNDFHIMTATLV
jgi:hypothetical protein